MCIFSVSSGLVDGTFQSFGVFYRQQYLSAYFGHLHQEVEPKKEGKALLLTHRVGAGPVSPSATTYLYWVHLDNLRNIVRQVQFVCVFVFVASVCSRGGTVPREC